VNRSHDIESPPIAVRNNAGRVSKVNHPPATQKLLNASILKLIVNKMLPFSILEGEDVQDIISSEYKYKNFLKLRLLN